VKWLAPIFPARSATKIRTHCALAALLSGCLTSGCVSTPIVVPAANNTFSGMNALLNDFLPPARPEKPRLRVLIIHGMGTTAPDQFNSFISSLATRLQLHQIPPAPTAPWAKQCNEPTVSDAGLVTPPPLLIDIDQAPLEARARLYTYDFGLGAAATPGEFPILSVSFLLWSPLTSSIKCSALAESAAPPRQVFADLAKGFINDKLADVALYAGTYRVNVMRPSVEKGLCYFVGGTPSRDGSACSHGAYQDPTVIVTHSLGSYMLMDAIDDQLTRSRRPLTTAAAQVLQRTQFVYMMANQLALLDLTTLTSYAQSAAEAQPQTAAPSTRRFPEMVRRFAKEWSNLRLAARVRVRTQMQNPQAVPAADEQIVAFNDPNDILSWLVQNQNVGLPKVFLANVYLSNNEFTIPPLFSDPTVAHTGYFDNRTVLETMICGMQNGAVGSCLPNGLQ
jgi:hypothetical protein